MRKLQTPYEREQQRQAHAARVRARRARLDAAAAAPAPRFAIACVRRVWYVIDTHTGARVSGGSWHEHVARADALQREQLALDADALRACTGAVAVSMHDGAATVTSRDVHAWQLFPYRREHAGHIAVLWWLDDVFGPGALTRLEWRDDPDGRTFVRVRE